MLSTPNRRGRFSRLAHGIWPVAATGILGCSGFEPSSALPAGAQAITAPAVYQAWWDKTEACSELQGGFGRIRWYEVPGATTFDTDMGPKVGLWIQNGNAVLIVVAGNYVNHEMVVRHEMLHALLAEEGHPSEYFVRRCHLTWESWRG